MEREKIYALMDIPREVTDKLNLLAENAPYIMDEDVKEKYLCRETFQAGYQLLKERIGTDPDGMKQLYAVLEAVRDTWKQYEKMGISLEIFLQTMKFIPRFLRTLHEQTGEWKFVQGWWFWRELAMVEFRVGCLEYELVEEMDRRFISLHIPGDADMRKESIDQSMEDFRAFLQAYYPAWQGLPWECDSWMMSPALKALLPENSKILAFQSRFDVLEENTDSLGVLDWVFPGHKEVTEALPENSTLQRNMKKWLLCGKKVGWTRAVLRQ